MVEIPPAMKTDAEDVVWALQTAEALWKRNERTDAIVWLRRAAQAAGDAQDDDRALALARQAAELSDYIAKNPVGASGVDDRPLDEPPPQPRATPPAFPAPGTPPPLSRPSGAQTPSPPPPPASVRTPVSAPQAESPVAVFRSVTSQAPAVRVPSAAEKHAGMLDPWSAPPEEERAPKPLPNLVPPDDYNDDDVVTSVRPESTPSTDPSHRSGVRPESTPVATPPAPAPATPPPLPKKQPPAEPTDSGVVSSLPEQAAKPTVQEQARPAAQFPPEQTLVSAGVVKADVPPLDLSTVNELADLPDDARAELQRSGVVHRLAREEEVMGFALAIVVAGEVDVAAQIVDAPAERLRAGAVLKAKGTVAGVPLRLIAVTDGAVVVTWDAEQIEPAFKSCPWVEDDLRASANRVQALVGLTLGSLAERLDMTLRAQVTARLALRELAEGEVVIEQGQPIREMAIVGQGSLELVSGGEVVGEVKVGEFLFPAEILRGGKASATARAGKGGALLLASERTVAQELLVTCPPLLEIFAGM